MRCGIRNYSKYLEKSRCTVTQSAKEILKQRHEQIRARTATPPRKPYARLEKLLGAVNTASNSARSSWVGFLGIQAYIFVTIAGVSHASLLLNSNVKLPVINTQLPLSSFFLFAPLVFLFAHFGFLLPQAMLSRKADTLNKEFEQVEAEMTDKQDYHPYRNEIVSYFFSQALVGPPPSLLYGVILHLMGWLTFVFFPLFLLLFFQIKFLPFHDALTTWFHRFYILADMIILFLVYKISLNKVAADKQANYLSLSKISTRLYRYFKILLIPKADQDYCRLDDNFIQAREFYKNVSWREALISTILYIPRLIIRTIGSINLFFIALSFLFFSFCIATFPNECVPWSTQQKNGIKQCSFSHETWLANIWGVSLPPKKKQNTANFEKAELLYLQKRHVFVPTSWFFEKEKKSWFSLDRNLNLSNKDFIDNKKFPATRTLEEPSISLRGRDFRHAVLDNSDLHFVDFSGADLSFASLEYTDLRRTNFNKAILQNTNLEGANLQNAQLSFAVLQGAYLRESQLENAKLDHTRLTAAYLGSANLKGANLKAAQLQGSYLGAARLQGANLTEANLQGSKLKNARLQGANLSYANLQGVNLQKARLQGATLQFAQLQGINLSQAHLEGANLAQTNLQFSQNLTTGFFAFTHLDNSKFWSLPKPEKAQLSQLEARATLEKSSLTKDNYHYNNDIKALQKIIKSDPSLKQRLAETLEKLHSLKSHNEHNKWESSKDFSLWQTTIEKWNNKAPSSNFKKGYTDLLARQACHDKTKGLWVFKSLMQRASTYTETIQPECFLKTISQPSCPNGDKALKAWPSQFQSLKDSIEIYKKSANYIPNQCG